jgi:DNA-binding NarL/FixJ family response regulator
MRKRQTKPLEQGSGKRPNRVFLVEDHPLFRAGLAQALKRENGIIICGESATAEKALELIPKLRPDLVLIDISLPGKSGLRLIKDIRAAGLEIKLLVLSMHDQALYADRVLRAGADGFVMKHEDPDEVLHAINDVLNGHIYVSEEVMSNHAGAAGKADKSRPGRLIDQLSDLELEILEMLGRGKDTAEIARRFHLSKPTVAARYRNMRKLLKLKTDNELIRYAVCWVECGTAD